MSATTPPDLAPPPLRENSRKKEKIWENLRKFEKIFPECQYIKMYSEKIRENLRKFEKIWEKIFPPKKSNTKNVYDNPPRSGTPPPFEKIREKKRKKEKIWENLRKFFPHIPPIQKMYSTTTPSPVPPPPDLDPPPPDLDPPPPIWTPPPLPIWTPCFSICFFLNYLRFFMFSQISRNIFLYWRYAGENDPKFSQSCARFCFLFFFFFQISNLNFPFLEAWSFNLTIPYHNIGNKQKIFRNVWAQDFLQRLLCFCFYMFFVGVTPISSGLLHPQAFIGY